MFGTTQKSRREYATGKTPWFDEWFRPSDQRWKDLMSEGIARAKLIKPPDQWKLDMLDETKARPPAVVAVRTLIKHAPAHGSAARIDVAKHNTQWPADIVREIDETPKAMRPLDMSMFPDIPEEVIALMAIAEVLTACLPISQKGWGVYYKKKHVYVPFEQNNFETWHKAIVSVRGEQ